MKTCEKEYEKPHEKIVVLSSTTLTSMVMFSSLFVVMFIYRRELSSYVRVVAHECVVMLIIVCRRSWKFQRCSKVISYHHSCDDDLTCREVWTVQPNCSNTGEGWRLLSLIHPFLILDIAQWTVDSELFYCPLWVRHSFVSYYHHKGWSWNHNHQCISIYVSDWLPTVISGGQPLTNPTHFNLT